MNRKQSVALVRALAAISWADGRLERSEESHLLSLGYRLGIGGDDFDREVRPLLAYPLPYDRAMEIIGDFVKVLGSEADRRLFLDEARELIAADGEVSADEESMLTDIESAVSAFGGADFLVGKLRSALGGFLPRRAAAPPLPHDLEPFAKNKALAPLLERLERSSVANHLSAAELNRAALEGALLARVAAAGDRRVDDDELAHIREIMARRGLSPEIVELVTGVAHVSDESMDRQRLCAEFNRVSTLAERKELVLDLFAVAGDDEDGDGAAEIRLLANFLWIPTRDFVELRGRAGPA